MIHHVTRATRIFIFWLLVILAAGSIGLRFVFAEVKNYQAELEIKISEILGVPIKVGKIRARMRGFNPELILHEISIAHNSNDQAIQLREVRLGIRILDVIKDQNLFSSTWMTLVGARLTVKRKKDGSFAVLGLKANDEQPGWLMQGGHFEVLDSEVSWIDELRQAKTEVIQHVNIVLNNFSDNRHELRMQVNLPEHYGKTITFMMDFSGDLFTKNLLTAKLYANAQKIRLTEIFASEIPANYLVDSGLSDFQLWSEWKNSKLINLSGDVHVQNGSVTINQAQSIPIEDLSGQFRWQRQADKWQLDVNNLMLKSNDKQWPYASFSLAVEAEQKVTAAITQLDLDQLSEWLLISHLLDEQNSKLLRKLNLQGEINNFLGQIDINSKDFSINGGINNLGFKAIDGYSAVHGLSGWVKGTNESGMIQVETDSAQLEMEKLFKKPLKLTRMDGLIHWLNKDNNWVLSSKILSLESPDIKTRNRFEITVSETEAPLLIDWQSYLTEAFDITKSKEFFPVRKMSKEFSSYMEQMFIAGQINKGKMIFYGHPNEFPYSQGKGLFKADLEMENVDLSYSSEWPKLSALQGDVNFTNQQITITANQGKLNGQKISSLEAKLPSWRRDAAWNIKGKLVGNIEQSLDFLKNSPLAAKIEPVVKVISPQGKNNIDVSLNIPVAPEQLGKVKVIASLENAKFNVLPIGIPVTAIKGDLVFTEQNIFCQNLTGQALGYPVQFNIFQDDEKSLFDVIGATDIKHLQQQFPGDWWQAAKGSLAYQLQLTVPYDEQLSSTLDLRSDLVGVQLDLPETLSKQADQINQFYLSLDFSGANLLPVRLNYANELKMSAMFNKSTMAIDSANLVYGQGKVNFIADTGLNLSINRDQLDLDSWLSVKENIKQSPGFLDQLNKLDLQVKELNWQNRKLGKVTLALNKQKSSLSGTIDTPFLTGKVAILDDAGKDKKVSLDLKRLDISAIGDQSVADDPSKDMLPTDLPSFDIKSEKVFWQGQDIGSLILKTEPVEEGLNFTQFDLTSNNTSLTTESGYWKWVNGEQLTDFKAKLQVKNLGVLLSTMEITDELIDTESIFDLKMQWPDTPFRFSLDKLSGTLKARLKSGRLLGVEPGIGRILGVLDLWQLEKRVRLDFSDLFLKGLSYDQINGDFVITNGLAKTDNLIIKAASAKIKMSGTTNLINKTITQEIFVIPKSAEVLPIAGKIVGGVAGAVAETITGKPKEGMFFGAHYKLAGTWSNPEVISQPANDGLLRKVWSGITDFSWLNSQNKNNKELINE